MQAEIKKEIDYVLEAHQLFSLLANEKTYAETEKSLLAKHENCAEEISRIFRLLKKIEKEAQKTFRKEKKDIMLYFKDRNEGGEDAEEPLADFILLASNMAQFMGKSAEEMKAEVEGISEEEYCIRFGEILQSFGYQIYVDSEEADKTPGAVMKRILKMKLPDEIKVLLQDIFWNREEHREKVFALLEKGEAFLRGFEAEISPELEIFYCFWKKKLENQNFFDYVRNEFQLNIEDNENGYEIWPALIAANTMGYGRKVEEDGSCKGCDVLCTGLLFTAGINPLHQGEKSDKEMENYAAEVLKLLGDRSKFEILSYIRDKSAYGSELARHLGLTTATISHHMNALYLCGLVELEKENNRVFYRANKEAVEEVLEYCRKVLLG